MAAGGLTSLVKFYEDGSKPGNDWAQGGRHSKQDNSKGSRGSSAGVLGQLIYSAYCEASYDTVWEHYAWHSPMPW